MSLINRDFGTYQEVECGTSRISILMYIFSKDHEPQSIFGPLRHIANVIICELNVLWNKLNCLGAHDTAEAIVI